MARRGWVFNPGSGGVNIPEDVQDEVRKRIMRIADERFKGKYTRLDIRFRGQFCYIDAFTDSLVVDDDSNPEAWGETKEEYIERVRNTPTHLCRLRYFGSDKWGFASYTYSNEKYELSVYPDGEFFGKPEEAFMSSAEMYLND
ncbi:MAG: hypothetical protein DRN71_01540 [Candidatus Nanohalarchaeota archaeon]|nr:MAG: hypothetical protein DRN71_01540 [Candidatus Nanohaloarchaeota archaeon]